MKSEPCCSPLGSKNVKSTPSSTLSGECDRPGQMKARGRMVREPDVGRQRHVHLGVGVDEEVLQRAGVGHVGGRADAGLQAQARAKADREIGRDLEARAERDRDRRQPVPVELGVQAVREILLALVGIEGVEVREVPVGDDAVEPEGEPVVEELRDEANHLVGGRLVPRARSLTRTRRLSRVIEPVGGTTVLQQVRRDGDVAERRPVGVSRVRDALGDRELGARPSVEGDPDLLRRSP